MSETLQQGFAEWVDQILIEQPAAPAYNFNLYEHPESFAVQLIGAARYDPGDPEWACDEVFSSAEDLFFIPRVTVGDDWRQGLEAARSLIADYLHRGKHADRLRRSRAVCFGFVDGDLEIAFVRKEE